jgi:hypothetical protein
VTEHVEFDGPVVEALREIVAEWIGEGFTTPPYAPEQYAIFEALRLDNSDHVAGYDIRRPPTTQEEET